MQGIARLEERIEALERELRGKHGSVRDALVQMEDRLFEVEERSPGSSSAARIKMKELAQELQVLDNMAQNLSHRLQSSRELLADLGFDD